MKIPTTILTALRRAFARHDWEYRVVDGADHRVCTVCGRHEEYDVDPVSSLWLPLHAGIRAKHWTVPAVAPAPVYEAGDLEQLENAHGH